MTKTKMTMTIETRKAMLYLPDEPGYTPRIVNVTIERPAKR